MKAERCFIARDKKIKLDKTRIMGILNLTPDSFSDGGSYLTVTSAVEAAKQMMTDGADIIDIGGQSTRPGFSPVSAEEEWERIHEVLHALASETDVIISVDTFYPGVAEKAIAAGAHIINDVSGFNDEMMKVAAETDAGCVIMYPYGEQQDIIASAKAFFLEKQRQAEKFGIKHERLCFDPGIGFGKTYEENLSLLANNDMYRISDSAILIGASRKRTIKQALAEESGIETEPSERDIGTLAAHTVSQVFGADIMRAHNVKAAKEAAAVADAVMRHRRKHG